MATIELKNLTKVFGKDTQVIKDLNLNVNNGEFLVLVGPSGCGKSTTLRIIAGLEEATGGDVYIDDKRVNNIAPKDRDIAMVFQNYALYPHMTVYDNMAFGLKLRKFPKDDIRIRVQKAAEILEISDLMKRKPKQLSGGQRQRVALGRSIVRQPKVFLFDEPLSNLDAKLRVQMRTEIKKLHKRLKTTMVYVTHDQVEAMTMGDRIAVMEDGIIHQLDTPLKLYHEPKDRFVAGFIGSPAMNFISATVTQEKVLQCDRAQISIPIPSRYLNILEDNTGQEIIVGIRPEDINIESGFRAEHQIQAILELVEPLGNEALIYLKSASQSLISISKSYDPQKLSVSEMTVYIDLNKIHLFDAATKKRLSG